jgi:SAM-dependent methyltransferase
MAETYFTHSRPEMLPFVPSGARTILDVGCGAGAFGAALKARRSDAVVTGVEIDPRAAEAARARLDRVLTGDALAALASLGDERFDTIVLNDVLEHVVDPEALLRDLAAHVAAGGCVVASIPNVREFFTVVDLALRGRWEYTDEGILDRTHLRFFTRASLDGLFGRGGFALERVVGINRTGSAKFKLFDLLTLGRFSEMGYLQWACVARPRDPGGT